MAVSSILNPAKPYRLISHGQHTGAIHGKLTWQFPDDPAEEAVKPWAPGRFFFFTAQLINEDADEEDKQRGFTPFLRGRRLLFPGEHSCRRL